MHNYLTIMASSKETDSTSSDGGGAFARRKRAAAARGEQGDDASETASRAIGMQVIGGAFADETDLARLQRHVEKCVLQ